MFSLTLIWSWEPSTSPIDFDWLIAKLGGDKRKAEHFLKGVSLNGKKRVVDTTAESRLEEESIDSERRRTKSVWSLEFPASEQQFE